jgi:hypothetical protein
MRHLFSQARATRTIAQPRHPDRTGAARHSEPVAPAIVLFSVVKFLVWCILLVLCWPLALLALILYPIVWILLLPFRVMGIAVEGALGMVRGIVLLPARLLRGPRAS